MKLVIAQSRGFCAGVRRAINLVEQALVEYGAPIYVRHAIVHNEYVREQLQAKGAVFIEHLNQVPNGQRVIFSAHGSAISIFREAAARSLIVLDAVCPLVKKVHQEIRQAQTLGSSVVFLGHKEHQEAIGSLGQYTSPLGKIVCVGSLEEIEALTFAEDEALNFVTQTTLSVEETKIWVKALQKKYPNIQGPRKEDICYATTNRQRAVITLAQKCDYILVLGSHTSSNANRLVETALRAGKPAQLVTGSEIPTEISVNPPNVIGLTSAASTPDWLLQKLVRRLAQRYLCEITELEGPDERVEFPFHLEWSVSTPSNSAAGCSKPLCT